MATIDRSGTTGWWQLLNNEKPCIDEVKLKLKQRHANASYKSSLREHACTTQLNNAVPSNYIQPKQPRRTVNNNNNSSDHHNWWIKLLWNESPRGKGFLNSANVARDFSKDFGYCRWCIHLSCDINGFGFNIDWFSFT